MAHGFVTIVDPREVARFVKIANARHLQSEKNQKANRNIRQERREKLQMPIFCDTHHCDVNDSQNHNNNVHQVLPSLSFPTAKDTGSCRDLCKRQSHRVGWKSEADW